MQATIGLAALSAAHFEFLQNSRDRTVTVDARHAAIEFSLCSISVTVWLAIIY